MKVYKAVCLFHSPQTAQFCRNCQAAEVQLYCYPTYQQQYINDDGLFKISTQQVQIF